MYLNYTLQIITIYFVGFTFSYKEAAPAKGSYEEALLVCQHISRHVSRLLHHT